MNVGDKIRIAKCDVCSKVVGKVATITKLNTKGQDEYCLDVISVEVKFGRGRPQVGRPSVFLSDDVTLIEGNSE